MLQVWLKTLKEAQHHRCIAGVVTLASFATLAALDRRGTLLNDDTLQESVKESEREQRAGSWHR